MQVPEIEHFRGLLLERAGGLTDWLDSATAADQEEVRKVQSAIEQIRAALERVERNSYGTCTVCDGEVEHNLLECHPEATVCLECMADSERRSLEEDLNMAGKMQRALLPERIPEIEGFDVGVRMASASVVGGDYYDFLPCVDSQQQTRVIIADAMGHGMSAGLLMSSLQGALRVLSLEIHSPARLVTRLNQWLCRNIATTKFISLVSLCLEHVAAKKTLLTYTNAGHCLPVVVRTDGTVEWLDVTGGVLGVHEQFVYAEGSISLSSGDLVVLYTDGVTEAANSTGDQFEERRLADFLKSNRHEATSTILDGLHAEISRFSGSSNRADDLTVIALRKR